MKEVRLSNFSEIKPLKFNEKKKTKEIVIKFEQSEIETLNEIPSDLFDLLK